MADKLVRGNSMDGAIRVFATVTTDLVLADQLTQAQQNLSDDKP